MSGTSFRLSPKELLRRHAPLNFDIVAVILPNLNPLDRLGDYRMLVLVIDIGIVKPDDSGQHLIHLRLIGFPAMHLDLQ